MDNVQIAHDLAIARLYGSELPTEELVKKYRKYYEEILSVLNSNTRKANPAKIVKPRI